MSYTNNDKAAKFTKIEIGFFARPSKQWKGKNMNIINSGKEQDYLIVSVEGRMDAVTTPEFEQKLGGWIDEGEIRFIVDFAGLGYISSAGLRGILTSVKRLKAEGGQIGLTSLHGTVKEVFEISGFSTIIPIYESVEAALQEM